MTESIDPILVGYRIREIRKRLGLSMTAFAERIDKKAKSGTVSNWETGKNLPNNDRLKIIAEIGNVDIIYLLTGENPADRQTRRTKEEMDWHIKDHQQKIQNTKIDNYIDLIEDIKDILQDDSEKEYELFRGVADYILNQKDKNS